MALLRLPHDRRAVSERLAVQLFIACAGTGLAQVAPTSTETARNTGMLVAARRGAAAEFRRLIATGADVNGTSARTSMVGVDCCHGGLLSETTNPESKYPCGFPAF